MNNKLIPAKGYYSILQFVPDLERAEGANIGVALFCPDKGFLQTFSDLLSQRGLANKVQRNVKIESALFQRTLIFPFAFQNGQLNVIEPVSLESTSTRNIERACQLAVVGNDLRERPQPVLLNSQPNRFILSIRLVVMPG
jgi:hypothetical protein